MTQQLQEIIKKLDDKIEKLINIEEYKPYERKLLDSMSRRFSFTDVYSSSNLTTFDLFLCAIILKGEYEDLKETLSFFKNKKLNLMEFEEMLEVVIDNSESLFKIPNEDLGSYLSKNMGVENIFGQQKHATTDQVNLFAEIVRLYKIADKELLDVVYDIRTIRTGKILCESKDKDFSKRKKQREFKSITDKYMDTNHISSQLKRISDLQIELESKNSKIIKNARKEKSNLVSLKNMLLLSAKSDEITNINKINELTSEDLKNDVLRYVADKNLKYYQQLDEQYEKIKLNSSANYIKLLADNKINFNSISKAKQSALLNMDIMFVEKVLQFLSFIGYQVDSNSIDIIFNTNEVIIDTIEDYIRKGILTNKFIVNNIGILSINEMKGNSLLYEVLLSNINSFLNEDINIIGLDEDSLSIFLEDSNIIRTNFDIIKELGINIKTRLLKDYRFLSKKNLKTILTLLMENVDFDKNIELINSDENLVKRIIISKNIGMNIYDEEGKIRSELLDEKQFFIPNSKLDNFIENKELVLQ